MRMSQLFPVGTYSDVYWAAKNRTHRYIVLKGGRSSVKGTTAYTISNTTERIIEGLKTNEDILVYVPTQKMIRNGCFKQMQNVLNRAGIKYTATTSPFEIVLINGQKILFEGIDALNTQKGDEFYKGTESTKGFKHVIFDEVSAGNDPKIEERINAIIKTLNRFNPIFWFIFNPPKNKRHWVFNFVDKLEKMGALIKHTTIYDLLDEDHKFVPDNVLQDADKQKEIDFKSWQHEVMGLAVGIDGLFFQNFKRENVLIDSYKGVAIASAIGIDYGEQNATTFSWWIATASKNRLKVAQFYYSGRDNQKELGVVEYAKRFKKWYDENCKRWGHPSIMYDPSAKALKIEIENQTGLYLRKGFNRRQQGWANIKGLISNNQFYFLNKEEMEPSISEYEMAEYDTTTIERSKTSGEDIKKENDHTLDADRMALWEIKILLGE